MPGGNYSCDQCILTLENGYTHTMYHVPCTCIRPSLLFFWITVAFSTVSSSFLLLLIFVVVVVVVVVVLGVPNSQRESFMHTLHLSKHSSSD